MSQNSHFADTEKFSLSKMKTTPQPQVNCNGFSFFRLLPTLPSPTPHVSLYWEFVLTEAWRLEGFRRNLASNGSKPLGSCQGSVIHNTVVWWVRTGFRNRKNNSDRNLWSIKLYLTKQQTEVKPGIKRGSFKKIPEGTYRECLKQSTNKLQCVPFSLCTDITTSLPGFSL